MTLEKTCDFRWQKKTTHDSSQAITNEIVHNLDLLITTQPPKNPRYPKWVCLKRRYRYPFFSPLLFIFSYQTCHNLGVLIGHFQTHPNIIHYFLYPNYITIISHDISNVWLNKIHKVVVEKASPWAMGLSQQPRLQQVFAPDDEGKGRLCGCLGHLPILRLLGRAGRAAAGGQNKKWGSYPIMCWFQRT